MSLAITEKRRPGGWSGVLFHLFDWNRRLTKKKLFSKKLLPPVHSVKRASKKFVADEKMPVANKLVLIADENCSYFVSRKEPGIDANGTLSPGLVARLMGLESMPLVQQENQRKAVDSRTSEDPNGGYGYREIVTQGKLDTRPQKLQKTGGFLEQRPSCGAPWTSPEVLNMRISASRSKQKQYKLASPVKSPRLLPKSGRSRLVQAATKILDPSLQSRNRARCAIAYRNEESTSSSFVKNSQEFSDSLVGSCRSCGSLIEVSELRLGTGGPHVADCVPSASDVSNASSSHSGAEKGKMEALVPIEHSRTSSLAVQAKINVQSRRELPERKRSLRYDRNNQEQCKPWQDVSLKSNLERNNSRRNQLPLVKDRVIHETEACSRRPSESPQNASNKARSFIASKGNSKESSQMRPLSKSTNYCRDETDRIFSDKSTVRKRRPVGCPQPQDEVAATYIFTKQRGAQSDFINRKGAVSNINRPINRNRLSSESCEKVDVEPSNCSKDNGVVCFTFSSPMRNHSRPLVHQGMAQKSRLHGELVRDASRSKKLITDTKTKTLSSQRESTLLGTKLNKVLEQKIKELTSLDQDELAKWDAVPERSTASILEELIPALKIAAPIPEENGDSCSDVNTPTNNVYHGCNDFCEFSTSQYSINNEFREEVKPGIFAAPLARNDDQPSPISILEASFSGDCCSPETPNHSTGVESHFKSARCFKEDQKLHLQTELIDSATSTDTKDSGIEKIHRSCGVGVSETRGSLVSEAILNARMLFEKTSSRETNEASESSMDSFINDTLESILDAFDGRTKCNNGLIGQEGDQLRKLYFDGIVEFLDSKCSRICMLGRKAWFKLPLNRVRLMGEVRGRIRGWRGLAGEVLDDLISRDLSLSALEWTEFESIALGPEIEIESNILHELVDEVVIDMCL